MGFMSNMLTRRSFFGVAACAAAGKVLASPSMLDSEFPVWRKGCFQIHQIHTGVAESQFLILPDGTTALIDCGDHPAVTRLEMAVPVVPNPGRLAGDWIQRYVWRVNPNGDEIDYMVPSHWHADHCGTPSWQSSAPGVQWWKYDYFRSGFGLAAEQLHFRHAIDRGWPDYNDPIPVSGATSKILDHMRRLYRHLERRDGLKVEKFRVGADDQLVPLRGGATGFRSFNLCVNGRVASPDGRTTNVYADLFRNGAIPGYLNENGLSIGHLFTYGKFSYFTAGDFSDRYTIPDGGKRDIEDIISGFVPAVSVAKVNHHGHWSMPASLVKALRPRVWLAGIWDQLHIVPNTLERLSNRAFYRGRKDVLVCPGVFPEPRLTKEEKAPYFRDIACECCGTGVHIVITVPPGGENFTVTFVSAADESMKVLGSRCVRSEV